VAAPLPTADSHAALPTFADAKCWHCRSYRSIPAVSYAKPLPASMKEIPKLKEEIPLNKKFFSSKQISFGTYLGGPLAGAYMIGQNFKSLGKIKKSKYSIYLGILISIIVFILLFLIPENILDKIPNVLFPAIYTVACYFIARHFFGNLIEKNNSNEEKFHSWWRAIIISLISFLILMSVVFAVVFSETSSANYEEYDKAMVEFQKNEELTLEFYSNLDLKPDNLLLEDINQISIPKWKDNIKIIEELNNQSLPSELIEHSKLLLSYSKLRLQSFELFKKSLDENTDVYTYQINQIHEAIEDKLDEINEL